MRLKNKVTIITGAGRGIGRGIAEAFAREGARVVVADLDAEMAQACADGIVARGETAVSHPTDVSNPEQVEGMVIRAVDEYGRLDILVSNAGIGGRKFGDGPVHDCTVDGWDTIMNVNLRGTFLACKYALPELLKTKGCIITMSSVLGLVGTQGLYDTHAYMTSKAAIIGLTRNIATHYAKDGVRANSIAPGLVDTVMAKRTKADPDLLTQVGFWQPLGPVGEVGDVAETAVFLASSDAKFITGTIIPVDGGWSAQ
ncbi:MAG: SDR family NAD(P)-dependent oxidoreductase [Chloroflexi bacterium]|nr:MAG: SDR family NAD(P)-dependent oxidoreductase [Chloroflexota bacterium]